MSTISKITATFFAIAAPVAVYADHLDTHILVSGTAEQQEDGMMQGNMMEMISKMQPMMKACAEMMSTMHHDGKTKHSDTSEG